MTEPRRIVTLTTDFGTGSPYVAQMKGVLLSINPEAVVVDVTHDIPPQDVRAGAIVVADVCWRFPPESIHVVVVDPGVGSNREILLAQIDQRWLIGPDNGLFWPVAESRPSKFWALHDRAYWLEDVSSTFHGRDIMAPAAAHLALGVSPDLMGIPYHRPIQLESPQPELQPDCCRGEIIQIDSFGNAVTNITAPHLGTYGIGTAVDVFSGDCHVKGIVKQYADRPPGELVALFGSTGRLEFAVVNGNAARTHQLRVGQAVAVRPTSRD